MLPHKNRIVKKEDFLRIKKYGRSYFSGSIELRVLETKLSDVRIGFIVGVRFSRKAVERNEVKRWMREALHNQLPKLKKNQDLLVSVRKKDPEKIRKERIRENLAQANKQAKITV